MLEVVKHVDTRIIIGHRTEADQNAAFHAGASQKRWPDGNHNAMPSLAVDAVPYPVIWPEQAPKASRERELLLGRMYMFVGFVRGVASQMGIAVRVGADWDGDFELRDQKFHDLPHIELVAARARGAVHV